MSAPLDDTTDLRTGAPIHDDLLALLPLVGVWSGGGRMVLPGSERQIDYVEQIVFSHDGRRFLVYESRTWRLEESGSIGAPAARETGFWRPDDADLDVVELAVVAPNGRTLQLRGASGDQQWEVETVPGSSAANRRLYALLDDALVYAHEVEVDGAWRPHANARLARYQA